MAWGGFGSAWLLGARGARRAEAAAQPLDPPKQTPLTPPKRTPKFQTPPLPPNPKVGQNLDIEVLRGDSKEHLAAVLEPNSS